MIDICDRCHKPINAGELRFVVRVAVAADDGGIVIDHPIEEPEIEELIRQLENIDPVELERAIFEERTFILCHGCKKKFVDNPFGAPPHDTRGGEGRHYLQ